MYLCMYVCMYVCSYVSMYLCMYVCMYVCTHACMYACSTLLYYDVLYILTDVHVMTYIIARAGLPELVAQLCLRAYSTSLYQTVVRLRV